MSNFDVPDALPMSTFILSAGSQSSPWAPTFTLPEGGIWLATALGSWNGSADHSIASTWLIYWTGDTTNEMRASVQLGGTAKVAGSANINSGSDLLLGSPAANTGVVTVTFTFAVSPGTPTVSLRLRKLSPFTPNR